MESQGHTFVKNVMTLTCAKIQKKILMFGEIGAPESSFFFFFLIRPVHFVNIRFILNNPRFSEVIQRPKRQKTQYFLPNKFK